MTDFSFPLVCPTKFYLSLAPSNKSQKNKTHPRKLLSPRRYIKIYLYFSFLPVRLNEYVCHGYRLKKRK